MDYYELLQRSVDFIEKNLTESFTLLEVAEQANCSLYHFHRIFSATLDISLKEYIRKRRLTLAAHELLNTNQRILDIALKYQYESPESFTRAFKKMNNITPSKYRKTKSSLNFFEEIDLKDIKAKNIRGGIRMKPRIITKEEFYVVGVELRTSNENNQNLEKIPEFWCKNLEAGLLKRFTELTNAVNPNTQLGICADFDDEKFTYIIGTEVTNLDNIPKGMKGRTIPAAKYAVFTAKGQPPKAVQDTWKYIYQAWFLESEYERADGPDFEYYGEKYDDLEKAECDIYIPIK